MKLFPTEYGLSLRGQSLCIAVKSDNLLKESRQEILKDIKYLRRFDVQIYLVHLFRDTKEVETFFSKHAKAVSLYGRSFDREAVSFAIKHECSKLLFVERQVLKYKNGDPVDAITLDDLPELNSFLESSSDLQRVQHILSSIGDVSTLKQVHILSNARPKFIRNELFSIEGVGTMITENMNVGFSYCDAEDIRPILNLLKPHVKLGNVLPRNFDYIEKRIDKFFKASIDNILAGCVEKIHLDNEIVEIGALVSVDRFLNRKVGKMLLTGIFKRLKEEGYSKALVVTKNRKFCNSLVTFYDFEEIKSGDDDVSIELEHRMERSFYAKCFIKEIAG